MRRNVTIALTMPRRFVLLLLLLLTCNPVLGEDWIYRIRAGETLGDIWERFVQADVPVTKMQAHNRIENDRTIPVGTEIRIPLEWLKQAPTAARIAFLRGEVSLYRRGAAEAVQVQEQDSLELGDRLVTGPYAVLSLRFADGSRLLLGPASEVSLDTLSAYGESGMVDTRLRVQRGRVESRVKPLKGSGSRYEIHTPAAVTMVRGTGFRVNVEGDSGLTRSEVFEGGVKVTAGGEEVTLAAGFGTRIEPGKAPEPPSRLLDPPDLSSLPEVVEAGDLNLEWPALEGAESYRLQLLANEPADAVLQVEQVRVPKQAISVLQAGTYRVVVSGIDAKGLEGLSADRTIEVRPAPEPQPVPTPAPSAEPRTSELPAPHLDIPQFGPGWVDFNWSEVAGAWSYRLLLARDQTCEEPVLERLSSQRRLRMPLPRPGRYYVRVDALFDAEGLESHSITYRLEIPRR